jgi:hypothetical protein
MVEMTWGYAAGFKLATSAVLSLIYAGLSAQDPKSSRTPTTRWWLLLLLLFLFLLGNVIDTGRMRYHRLKVVSLI